ncbi:hypothetical protein SAMN06265376_102374 [Dokdonia pacifica]|uniref:Uncharacterized protein n=1 Tax=Dokdonia pacifica TaxID=1627892 RepID=A0A238YV21_9FLAO|nr:hypothetical protein SAMN06265376_102374 [Dokdonia pacifica]
MQTEMPIIKKNDLSQEVVLFYGVHFLISFVINDLNQYNYYLQKYFFNTFDAIIYG